MKLTPVSEADDGIRLDRWFARHYPSVTHVLIQKALRSKLIKVDNKRAEAGQRLEAGQLIKHPEFAETLQGTQSNRASARREAGGVGGGTPPSQETLTWLQSLILYQDDQVIVLNKPAGLATQGGSGLGDNHIDALLPALGGAKLVHRLDKDTSGVLLLARDAKTAAALTKIFAQKQAQKTYWALVSGVPNPPQGVINAPLAKIKRGGQELMAVDPEGQRSQTEYRVVDKLGKRLSWLELSPLTGRTHQLRVHCLHLGHPIYGDGKYAGRDAFPEGLNLPHQLHLHARRLQLTLPGGKSLDISAPLPPHMAQSWEMLGLTS